MNLTLKYHIQVDKVVRIADVISGVILLLFLYTSLSKLLDYETFKSVLSASPLLRTVAGHIAWMLPVSELVIVLLLFLPPLRLKGLYASFILIGLFTLYLIYMILFAPNLPCSCGGVIRLLTWPEHIFFNLFFMLLSLTAILLYKRAIKMKRNHCPP
jgi:hypothetical protein